MIKIRIGSLIALIVSVVVSVDLLVNFLGNLVPSLNDGLEIHSILAGLFFGDDYWSLEKFYKGFVTSSAITLAFMIENAVLAIKSIGMKKER